MKRFSIVLICAVAIMQIMAQTLNVASYNIRLHTQADYPSGNGWIDRRDAMCDLIAFMAFDVFGAQEVCHDQLTDMLERLPEYGYVGVARDDGAIKGEYSPVFYRKDRFELLDSGTFWLSETPDIVSYGWDADCRRVCSWAHLKDSTTKKDFWFFNTHLDHIGIVARENGVKLLESKIRLMCGENANVILTGDFNAAQNSVPYNTLAQSSILRDAYNLSPIKYAPTGTFNNFDIERHSSKRIDHIFVSGFDVLRYGILTFHYWNDNVKHGEAETLSAAEAHNPSIRLPSDHYPVQVILKFTE